MKKILIALAILLIIGAGIGYYGYKLIFSANVKESTVITIPSGSDLEATMSALENSDALNNMDAVRQVAQVMKYSDSAVRPGKYEIKKGWNSKEVVGLLRSGRQQGVKVTFNNHRTKEDLAGKISSYLEMDSLTLVKYFQDPKVHTAVGLNNETFMSLFIPNTYEIYWTASPEEVVERLRKEHEKFWSREEREAKAKRLNLQKEEVYTVASLVEKESNRSSEKPRIAGMYLNRIRIGMPLQADPTVVFATGEFGLRRVLNKHLEFDSPYNTYLYAGLPPGPIYMPSISSIDGVLNHEEHKYLYMCSSPEIQGAHLFAETLSEHNANARKYHRWLDSKGIR